MFYVYVVLCLNSCALWGIIFRVNIFFLFKLALIFRVLKNVAGDILLQSSSDEIMLVELISNYSSNRTIGSIKVTLV